MTQEPEPFYSVLAKHEDNKAMEVFYYTKDISRQRWTFGATGFWIGASIAYLAEGTSLAWLMVLGAAMFSTATVWCGVARDKDRARAARLRAAGKL